MSVIVCTCILVQMKSYNATVPPLIKSFVQHVKTELDVKIPAPPRPQIGIIQRYAHSSASMAGKCCFIKRKKVISFMTVTNNGLLHLIAEM